MVTRSIVPLLAMVCFDIGLALIKACTASGMLKRAYAIYIGTCAIHSIYLFLASKVYWYWISAGIAFEICTIMIYLIWYHSEIILGIIELLPSIVDNFLHSREEVVAKRKTLRKTFREIAFSKVTTTLSNVLHPVPRSNRRSAIQAVANICALCGYRPYYVQPREEQQHEAHRLTRFWAQDTDIPPANDSFNYEEHLSIRMDSDYYESASYIAEPGSKLIYTFDPLEVAMKHVDYPSWKFVDHETIKVESPAEMYEHKLWDYSGTYVTSFKWTWRKLFKPQFIHYDLEKRRVSETHSLVLLNMRLRHVGLSALVARLWFPNRPLARVDASVPGCPEHALMEVRVQSPPAHYYSIGRLNTYLAAHVEVDDYAHLLELTLGSKVGCTIPKVKTKINLDDATAAVLTNYFNQRVPLHEKPYTNYSVDYGVRTYQMYPNTAVTDPKPSLVCFMSPLVHGAYAPALNLSSEVAAIEGRLTKLVSNHKVTAQHQFYYNEFISRVVGGARHTLIPVEDDYIYEMQNRPSQRVILEAANGQNSGRPYLSTFVKKEAYGKISDPRIISTLRPTDKLEISRLMYSLGDWIKQFPWYGFSKTPCEIESRCADIAVQSSMINCTDFSRMDGRKNARVRMYNRALLLALFQPKYHATIIEMCERDTFVRGSTKEFDDETYDFISMLAWASGHPLTSFFNTCDNALIVFTGKVNELTGCGQLQPTTEMFNSAWNYLMCNAILAGDDTFLGDMPSEPIEKAAAWWGHVLTSETYQRGEAGANFLARVYGPNIWHGERNNCTDIMRALAKLHTSPNLAQYTPLQKLSMKLSSLWFTDENTPVIRDIIAKWKLLGGNPTNEVHVNEITSFWAQYDRDVQYTNNYEDWMEEFVDIDDSALIIFSVFLESVDSIDQLLHLPCIKEVDIKPHAQQTVVDNLGDQMLVGDDDTRVDQPLVQVAPVVDNVPPLDAILPAEVPIPPELPAAAPPQPAAEPPAGPPRTAERSVSSPPAGARAGPQRRTNLIANEKKEEFFKTLPKEMSRRKKNKLYAAKLRATPVQAQQERPRTNRTGRRGNRPPKRSQGHS